MLRTYKNHILVRTVFKCQSSIYSNYLDTMIRPMHCRQLVVAYAGRFTRLFLFSWRFTPLSPAIFLGNQTYFLVKTRLFLRSTLSCLPWSKRWAFCFITLLTSAKNTLIDLPWQFLFKCKQTWRTTTGQCQPEAVHSHSIVSITSVVWWRHHVGVHSLMDCDLTRNHIWILCFPGLSQNKHLSVAYDTLNGVRCDWALHV